VPQFCIIFCGVCVGRAPESLGACVGVRAGEAMSSRRGDRTRMYTTIGSVAFALSLAGGAITLTAAPIEDLSGYWSGSGSVTLSNGRTESVKCAVTYKVSDGGGQVRQSMRCASADYSINALAELQIKGSQVSGSWEEKTYSATGLVTGRYTGSNFVLSIEGANFTAAMNVSVSDCKQSISIAPKGLEVSKISIGLGKC
jgi:hypothetical protein